MCFFGTGNPIAVGVGLQLLHYALANSPADRGIRGSDERRDRRCSQMVQCEFIEMGQMDIDPNNAHVHSRQTRFDCETLQFIFAGDLPRGGKLLGSCIAHESSQRFSDGTMVEPDAVPHAECETAAPDEHATDLLQRDGFVWKEL